MKMNLIKNVIAFSLCLLVASSLHAGVYQMDQTEGRYIRIEMPGNKKTLSFAEVQVFSGGKNIALNKTCEMSSQFSHIDKYSPGGAVDMATGKGTGPRTKVETNPWWVVDLGKSYAIDKIIVYRSSRSLKGVTLKVANQKDGNGASYTQSVGVDAAVLGFTADAKKMQDLGSVWLIGDQLTLGDKDNDPNSSPRSALYNSLSNSGYTFRFTGHDTASADGLPADAKYTSHSAMSGAKIADVSKQLDSIWSQGRLKSDKPDFICIMLGTNDIHNDLFDGAPERMKALIDKLYALPGIGRPVVFVGAIPPNQTIERRKTNVNIFNEALEGLVADYQMDGKDIHFVDHFSALGGERPQHIAAHMLADSSSDTGIGADLGARGNQVAGTTWFNAIEVPRVTAGTDTEPWLFPKAISVRSVVKHAPSYLQYTLKIPGGGTCTIIPPKPGVVHKSGKKPWMWRNIFYSSNTGQSIKTDLKLIDEGY